MKWWADGEDLYTDAEYGRAPLEDSPTVVESPTSEGAMGLQPGEMAQSRMANQRALESRMVAGVEGGLEMDYEAGGLEEPSEVPSARAMVAGMQD